MVQRRLALSRFTFALLLVAAMSPAADPASAQDGLHPKSSTASESSHREPRESTEEFTAALHRFLTEVRLALDDGNVRLIWLIDASGSAESFRRQLMEHLPRFYEELQRANARGRMKTEVVAYARNTQLLTPDPIPGFEIGMMLEALSALKSDPSGIENLLTAVRLTVEHCRKHPDEAGRTMFCIVTDERGDDFQRLEEAVQLCRDDDIRVFCLAAESVLGEENDYVVWRDTEGESFAVPVQRGSDNSHAELLHWSWHLPRGDSQFSRRISSGRAAWILERLCRATNGACLLAARADGLRFNPRILDAYAPDYRSQSQLEAEVQANPAKRALVQAAVATYANEMSGDYGSPKSDVYIRAFNVKILKGDLDGRLRVSRVQDYQTRQIVDAILPGEIHRNTLTEPRWRASFDLALGRSTADQLRMRGYIQALSFAEQAAEEFANGRQSGWRLRLCDLPLDDDPESMQLRDRAVRALDRVIAEHPGTPWAEMAAWELAAGFVWTWEPVSTEALRNSGKFMEKPMLFIGRQNNDGDAVKHLRESEATVQRERSRPRSIPKL